MDVHTVLKQFDFTESETKVYLALLQHGYCTGYEASKHSGVARSKIYGVLDSLYRKGALERTLNSESNHLYKAVNGHQLRKILSKKMQSALDVFEQCAQEYETPKDSAHIWTLEDYAAIILKTIEVIGKAESELLLQIWKPELTKEVEAAVKAKEQEGIRVVTVLYDSHQDYDCALLNVYPHGFETEKLEDNGARWFTIVADRKAMIHASLVADTNAQAVYTENQSMAYFAREYVLHDAYCLKLLQKVKSLEPTFDMTQIRNVY